MNRRNRALAAARWDPAVGNYGRFMRFGPIDWRYQDRKRFAPLSKRTQVLMRQYLACAHDWRRLHRKPRLQKGQLHQRCIRCGFSRLHPKHTQPLRSLNQWRADPVVIVDDVHHSRTTSD